jgi:nitrite reductase (NO-forming)
MQTTLLGSSNSATVEFVIPEDGSYIMVDHRFANASQGAIVLISTAARLDGTGIANSASSAQTPCASRRS